MRIKSLLILFSLFSFSYSFSQDIYKTKWKRVDSLMQQEGLTETASREIESILKKARTSNNQAQVIKALQYKAAIDMEKRENALPLSIDRFEKELKTAAQPGRSVIQSILAESYWIYLQQNRYRLYDISNAPSGDKDDLSSLSIDELNQHIREGYLNSISETSILQKTPVSTFDAIIEKGNARKYRPTLYDLLAYRAIDYFRNDEVAITKPASNFRIDDKRYFSPAGEFIKLQLKKDDSLSNAFHALTIYQKLLAFHKNDSDATSFIDADIQRITYVYQQSILPNKESLYITALEQIVQSSSSQPAADQASYLLAEYYANRAATYDPFTDSTHRNDYNIALKVLEKVITANRKSEGSANALNLRNRILSKTLTHRVEAVNVPKEPFRALIEYKNTTRLYYRIISLEPSKRDSFSDRGWEDEFWEAMVKLPYLLQKDISLPATDDHQLHRVEIGIDALPIGEYVMLTSGSNDFGVNDSNPLSLNRFAVSSISYIQTRNDFFVLDRNTGKPLTGAIAAFYKLSQGTKHPSLELQNTYKSDINGKFSFKDNPQDYSQKKIEFRYEKDFLVNDYQRRYYSYNNDDEGENNVDAGKYETDQRQGFFFADRSIYRPGQEIFFKGIYITRDFKSKKPKVLNGFKSMIFLIDANGQRKDSVLVTSNEYGSVKGSFRLPSGLLNGEFSIQDRETNASVQVSVEEYKRPKFMVELKMPSGSFRVNDSIKVHGVAKAFAGNMIGGAKLNYKVVRKTILPIWTRYSSGKIWPPRRGEQTIITTGTITTNASGEFSIPFVAIPDPEVSPSTYPTFHYEVQADVIDINGESHSGTITVIAGYQSIQIDMKIPSIVKADSLHTLNITTRNLNGFFEKSSLLIALTRLQEPAGVYRKRYWQQPDQFIYTEAAFHKLFPIDEYQNESTPAQWKKTNKVITLQDTSSITSSIDIKVPIEPGYYEVIVNAISAAGDTVKSQAYIQVTGEAPQTGATYVHLYNKAGKLKLNEKLSYELSTNLQDVFLIKQLTINDSVSDATIQLIKNELKDPGFTINQYGNARIDIAFVKYNRFYTQSIIVPITDESKKLDIKLTSFRSKVLPGSKENWKLKIAGTAGEQVAAELLTGMYDHSLDQFKPHVWQLPSIWNMPLANSGFFAPLNFQVADPMQRDVSQEEVHLFNKFYDMLIVQHESLVQTTKRNLTASVVVTQDAAMNEVVVMGYGTKKEKAQEDSVATPPTPSSPAMQIRKDFRETAFFFPDLSTDQDGNMEFSFTMPEAITSWKWMTIANTKDLAFGYKEAEIVSQKELMTQPNLPRFLREGDRIDLSTRIVNMGSKEITGQVQLELIDPETNQSVDGWFRNVFPNQYFTVAAGESSVASFSLEIPFGYAKPVIYRFTASNDSLSDGEEGILPVLLGKIMVTETATLPLFNQKSKQVKLDKLINSGNSETLTTQSLTVEFTSNPSWFAIQSLPHLAEVKDGSSEQVFYRIYSGSITRKIIESNPEIASVFDQWKTDTSLRSKLQQNEVLKSVLLQQTPWVLEAKTESENIQQIAEMFRYWKVQQNLLDAVNQLRSLQRADGSFSWMNGGPSDRFVTQNIIAGIGRLMHMNALNKELHNELNNIVSYAMTYLDQELIKDYELQKKSTSKQISINPVQVQYLYTRSLFPTMAVPGKLFTAYNYYRKLSTTAWVTLSRQLQGMTALSLFKTGDKMNAFRILKSLKENAINNQELGMYWKESNYNYAWHQSSISTQSILIETFNELSKDTILIDRMKLWLIKNKQTNAWAGDKSTADACYALLNSGSAWINSKPEVEIQLRQH